MTTRHDQPLPVGVRRMVAGLMRLFPSDFQRELRTDVERFVEDEWRDSPASSRASHAAAVTFLFRVVRSLVVAAVRLRLDEYRRRCDWGLSLPHAVFESIDSACRALTRRPRFTVIATALLVVGLSGSAALTMIADALAWRSLPFTNPDTLVSLREKDTRSGYASAAVSERTLRLWREHVPALARIAAFEMRWFNTDLAPSGATLRGSRVTPEFFAVMGVQPRMGRIFDASEDRHSGVAIVSEGFWRRGFGGAETLAGQVLMLDGRPHRIVGVMPAPFKYYGIGWQDVWVPMRLDTEDRRQDERWLMATGRVDVAASVETVRTQIEQAAAAGAAIYPASHAGWSAAVSTFPEYLQAGQRPLATNLAIAATLVLLVTCASFGILLTMHLHARRPEWHVRLALGARLGRLVFTTSVEFGACVLCAASLAFVLVIGAGPRVASALPDVGLERLSDLLPPARAAFLLAVLALAPLLVAAACTVGAATSLRQRPLTNHQRGGSRAAGRLQPLLVAVQVGFAVLLLAVSLVLARSLHYLDRLDLGFRLDHVVNALITFPATDEWTDERRAESVRALVDGVSTMPGVQAVSGGSTVPLWGQARRGVVTDSATGHTPGEEPTALYRVVTADYFTTLDVAVTAGRVFTRGEEFVPRRVVLLNAAAARRFFGVAADDVRSVVGRYVTLIGDQGDRGTPLEVIGIVGDERQTTAALTHAPDPAVYVPYDRAPERWTFLLVRHSGAGDAIAASVRQRVAASHPGLVVSSIAPATELLANQASAARAVRGVATAFGAFAMGLALIALYAVVSQDVVARSRELAIRLALGAPWRVVASHVTSTTMLMAAGGLIAGVIAARGLVLLLVSHVPGIAPSDPLPYLTACAVTLLLAAPCVLSPLLRLRRSSFLSTLTSE